MRTQFGTHTVSSTPGRKLDGSLAVVHSDNNGMWFHDNSRTEACTTLLGTRATLIHDSGANVFRITKATCCGRSLGTRTSKTMPI
jgi:hypothetical protein